MRFVAALTEPDSIRTYLSDVGLPPEPLDGRVEAALGR